MSLIGLAPIVVERGEPARRALTYPGFDLTSLLIPGIWGDKPPIHVSWSEPTYIADDPGTVVEIINAADGEALLFIPGSVTERLAADEAAKGRGLLRITARFAPDNSDDIDVSPKIWIEAK